MRDRYASLRDGLIGAWIPSVSGSGLLLPDLSGQGNNGTLTNMGPEDWVSGQYGRALDFDGSNDQKTQAEKLTLQGDISLTAWVYLRNTSLFQLVCGWNAASAASSSFSIRVFQNKVQATVFSGNSSVRAEQAITANRWISLCALYKPSKQEVSVVLDNLYATASTSSLGAINQPTTPFTSGGLYNASTAQLNGQLDDVRIYNRALSEPEIKLLASRPGIGLRPQRRTMYYAPPTGARRRRILTSMP